MLMECARIVFSGHAIRRMFERGIGKAEIACAISSGELILDYPEDSPYPSRLLLAFVGGRPLHVLVAMDDDRSCYIITCYEPAEALWNPDFKTRKAK